MRKLFYYVAGVLYSAERCGFSYLVRNPGLVRGLHASGAICASRGCVIIAPYTWGRAMYLPYNRYLLGDALYYLMSYIGTALAFGLIVLLREPGHLRYCHHNAKAGMALGCPFVSTLESVLLQSLATYTEAELVASLDRTDGKEAHRGWYVTDPVKWEDYNAVEIRKSNEHA